MFSVKTGFLPFFLRRYLDPLLAQEVRCGVQDVGCVGGVVVGVAGVVVSFDHLEPRAQSHFGAAQELTDAEAGEDLQAQEGQRPAGRSGGTKDDFYSHRSKNKNKL